MSINSCFSLSVPAYSTFVSYCLITHSNQHLPMKIPPSIQHWRKKITQALTGRLGQSRRPIHNPTNCSPTPIHRILIIRPNHRLGNTLLITPIVAEMQQLFPTATVDLFVKGGIASEVFREYPQVDRIMALPKKHFKALGTYLWTWIRLRMRSYDLVINSVSHSSSGRLATAWARGTYKWYGDRNDSLQALRTQLIPHMAHGLVMDFRTFWTPQTLFMTPRPLPLMDLKLSAAEKAVGKAILSTLVPTGRKTIALFTFATGAKCYPPEWWIPFYQRLQTEFPEYNFIEILPAENVSQIDFAAPTLYSKSIREMAAVIANCSLFLGADSGVMHLASAALTPTVGLFQVTDPALYGPYGNHSFAADTRVMTTASLLEQMRQTLLLIER
jgi:heptosyltransferase-3